MISRSRTPKLNTSDLIEKRPSEAYSGAMYPLKKKVYQNSVISHNITIASD